MGSFLIITSCFNKNLDVSLQMRADDGLQLEVKMCTLLRVYVGAFVKRVDIKIMVWGGATHIRDLSL